MSNGATIAGLRLGAAAVIATALCFQAWADLTYGTFTWVELPVYFTPLAAIASIVALGCAALAGPTEPHWVSVLRVNAATYAIITGVVYWSLLPHYGHPTFPWANAIIHGGTGVILLVDWVVVGQRERLPWHTLWTVFGVPAVWLAYVAVHRAISGGVPYPFLDPSGGVTRPIVTIALMLASGLLVVTALRWCTGLRIVMRRAS